MPPKCLRYLYVRRLVRQRLLKVGPRYVLASAGSEVWKPLELEVLLRGIAHWGRFPLFDSGKNLPKEVVAAVWPGTIEMKHPGEKLSVLGIQGLSLCHSLLMKQNHSSVGPLEYGGHTAITDIHVKISVLGGELSIHDFWYFINISVLYAFTAGVLGRLYKVAVITFQPFHRELRNAVTPDAFHCALGTCLRLRWPVKLPSSPLSLAILHLAGTNFCTLNGRSRCAYPHAAVWQHMNHDQCRAIWRSSLSTSVSAPLRRSGYSNWCKGRPCLATPLILWKHPLPPAPQSSLKSQPRKKWASSGSEIQSHAVAMQSP